jgi:hypothetical protein
MLLCPVDVIMEWLLVNLNTSVNILRDEVIFTDLSNVSETKIRISCISFAVLINALFTSANMLLMHFVSPSLASPIHRNYGIKLH